jgi:hypothetical protein
MFVGFSLVGLSACAGIGWYAFRRILLPQTQVKLPPSGARPWSRTRTLSPESLVGDVGLVGNVVQTQMDAFPAPGIVNNGFAPSQPDPSFIPPNNAFGGNIPVTGALQNNLGAHTQSLEPLYGGMSAPADFRQQGLPGNGQYPQSFPTPSNGFAGLSDGFIPPSPQIFAQNEPSMIPPGSGTLPIVNNRGFAPASSDFNAMYGLPDDPFGSSFNNEPSWLEALRNDQGRSGSDGNSFGGFPQPAPAFKSTGSVGNGFTRPLESSMDSHAQPFNGSAAQRMVSFTNNGQVSINDPELTEIIRQYSEKSQALPHPESSSLLPPSDSGSF